MTVTIDLNKIEQLCKSGESFTLEFKASTANLRSAFETICAFLNGKGGTVLIGVKDSGQIIGQAITDKTQLEIANEIKKIEPTATIEVQYIKFKENQSVIAIHADAGNHIPYVYDSRPFQRHESQTDKMSQHRYEQLLVMRGQLEYSWEESTANEYTLDDLDHEEIYKTIADGIRENRIPASAQREDIKQILTRLSLINNNGLKRAAIVLYAKQESMKFVQCMIKMARFKGINKLGDFIDNQQIFGNAFKVLSEVDAFLRRHLAIASFFKPDQFKRIDQPTLPILAIREALINAICHRDYSDRTTNISLAIYDDRLELWNSGILLKNLTIENLKHDHESILRNALIANVFYVRGLIEKWGTGTNKMIALCKKEDAPEPNFMERTGGIVVIFSFRAPLGMPSQNENILSSEGLSNRQKIILEFLKSAKTASTQTILEHINSISSDVLTNKTIVRDLNHLKILGIITLKGKKRGAVWVFMNDFS